MEQQGLPSQHSLCLLQADAAVQVRSEEEANRGLPRKLQHHDKLDWNGGDTETADDNQ
jgi:hypothetical protein